ncbi:elongator complex protein 6-like isoform X2 [Apostichopus japonicus]|uniref:elongator complex protein 6-like isoform X2 n=1 Tax=Stichopus japonicus TaxID=307972 RepID=UPI003AB229A5
MAMTMSEPIPLSQHKVIFVSLAQSFGHYNSVAQKFGTHIATAKGKGQLSHLDGLSFSLQLYHDGNMEESETGRPSLFTNCVQCRSLRHLYDTVSSLVSSHVRDSPSSPISVIIDDLSVLMALGFHVQAIAEFIHYCRVTLKTLTQSSGNLVSLVHNDIDVGDEDSLKLTNVLSHQADILIQIEGLTSGFSKDVHGQMTIINRSLQHNTPGRRKASSFHYKILDKTVSLFPIGTSSAVL